MKKYLIIVCLCLPIPVLRAQSFEVSGVQDAYHGAIGEVIRAPIHIKNLTSKPITLIIRKVSGQLGSTQKTFYCVDNDCLDGRADDYVIRLEPEQDFGLMQIALDAGLAPGHSSLRYHIFNKSIPGELAEFDVNFVVEERTPRQSIYNSAFLALDDVYPNPVSDYVYVDYRIFDARAKVKIVIHTILGNAIEEYPLTQAENKVKISAEALSPGIYFYTLYLDGEGLVTRKLIVRK